jgi:hypothetical protein
MYRWYLWVVFKVIGPFMDPETKKKIHFIDLANAKESDSSSTLTPKEKEKTETGDIGAWIYSLDPFIESDNLCSLFGGSHVFEFDHSVYWKYLNHAS